MVSPLAGQIVWIGSPVRRAGAAEVPANSSYASARVRAWISSPASPPTMVPLMRMYCRSGPISRSISCTKRRSCHSLMRSSMKRPIFALFCSISGGTDLRICSSIQARSSGLASMFSPIVLTRFAREPGAEFLPQRIEVAEQRRIAQRFVEDFLRLAARRRVALQLLDEAGDEGVELQAQRVLVVVAHVLDQPARAADNLAGYCLVQVEA